MTLHIVQVRQVYYRHVIVNVPEYDDSNPWRYEDAAVEAAQVAVNRHQGFFNPDARIKTPSGGFDAAWEGGDDTYYEFDDQPLDDDAEPLNWWAERGYPTANVVVEE